MNVLKGNLIASKDVKLAIVVGRFNEFIGGKLLDGAIDAALRYGIADERISIAWVPGAFEIPLIAKKMASSGAYNAVVCLGAIIKGSTPHFDYVASEVAKGVAALSLQSETPIIFGILTTDTIEQAIERAGTKHGNKGADAVITAIEMINLIKQL